jgi:hypothetical protein
MNTIQWLWNSIEVLMNLDVSIIIIGIILKKNKYNYIIF